MIFFIRCYQRLLSPFMISRCRFYPSCSQYAIDALHHHGLCKGLFYFFYRLLRCHPWSQGGFDPIISKQENN